MDKRQKSNLHRRPARRAPDGATGIYRRLYDAIWRLEIVDAHEHWPPEKVYLATAYSGANFFGGYVLHDLASAGLDPEVKSHLRDGGYRPVASWWPQIAPFWDQVRHGSYARAAIITARELYGIGEINDRTIHKLAAKIRADNRPGLYERILRKSRIRVALTNAADTNYQDDPRLRPVPFLRDEYFWTPDGLRRHAAKEKVVLRKLEDLVAAETRRLVRLKARGAVGFKTRACRRAAADEAAARLVFNRIMRRGKCAQVAPLDDYLFGKCLEAAGELEVPVAVHAGLWGNFPEIAPALMIPWAQQYPKTHFDLFHLGFPNTLEAVVIGKNFPNVSLNLCWCYLLSPSVTRQMLEAILDLVPLNKVIGFGGDYLAVVQKVYGHRAMATETIAAVLARRVAAGEFSEDRALEIARRWLCANPAAIYRV